ncbi:hypothetical protein Y032_0032g2568 [Ancylostoma ceylanicum]|uniref:Uncharacterized protein n=1 Tax=Ancylostoma ceylanicum TaxID=53326 RepID=A0A016UQZ7_9BILA|nr:hypothetical protein Y032_0032g2568 [Ancylostoma ceylanicum]
MYSLRTRSGSVERNPAPSTVRSTYTPRDTALPSRSSRASSYDPFAAGATRIPMSTPFRTDRVPYSRPSYSGMSHSYHDYSAPSRTSNRYGSTEQLHYKSPFTSSSSSGYGGSSLYRSNPSFTRAGSVGFSDSRREYTPSSSYSTAGGSLARYRPGYSSASTSSYQPRSSFDYRSKTPGYERDTTSRAGHYDRDTRSMSRTEKTPISDQEDDVERTFQKLYNRYVKEDESDKDSKKSDKNSKNKAKARSFISHSEAEEEASSDEEQSPDELDNSFAETLRNIRRRADPSVTPRGSNKNSPDATPKCSPMLPRKREEQNPNQPATKDQPEKKEVQSAAVTNKSPAEEFREKHSGVDFKPVVVPEATLKPATSAMDKFLRRDSLTTKLTEAMERKKSLTPASENGKDNSSESKSASQTPSRSVSPNVAPTTDAMKKTEGNNKGAGKSASPSPAKAGSNASVNGTSETKKSPTPAAGSKEATPTKTAPAAKPAPSSNGASPASQSVQKESSPAKATTTESNGKAQSPASGKNEEKNAEPVKAPLPIIVTSSVENQEDRSSSQEPTAEFTIALPETKKRSRSRSSSPARKHHRDIKESTPQFLTVDSMSPRKLDSHHHHHHKMRRSASPCSDHSQSDHGNANEDDEARKGHRKKRDPTRTLDNLKEKLEKEKGKLGGDGKQREDSTGSEDGSVSELKDRPKPPLLMVTQPSVPSTPLTTTVQLWDESTDADWTEAEDEADYESDFEYSVSQTFSLKDCMPIGDLYPLSRSSSRCSPFVSDYDSDTSMPLFMLPSRAEESRGRVDRLLANPPPSFTCSITYDGQESWDEESLHSCTDFDDEYFGRHSRFSRPGSSALGAYLSPTTYSSDEPSRGLNFREDPDHFANTMGMTNSGNGV